ncbi:reticulon-like protein B13 [Henckelia pumila]|uniref:reticulon-like protein B13 n=1 Tax=Henckelia pumila TaxID=405737 RepID=UPI003C6E0B8B
MSASPESDQPPPPKTAHHEENPDWVRDIMLWRRKDGGILLLLAATATWVAMEIYEFKFVTLASWLAMAIVVCLFAWGNLNRLFNKESPDLSRFEISEQSTAETATLCQQRINGAIRMMLHVGAESEWIVFAGVMASFYALSLLGSYFDLLTICYMGILGGLTVPLIYVKNEVKINEYVEKLKIKSERWYFMFREKLQKIINKLTGKQKEPIKEKKIE